MDALRSLLHQYQADADVAAVPAAGDTPFRATASVDIGSGADSIGGVVAPLILESTALTIRAGPGSHGDWSGALRLVHRAAEVIADYERRFRAIETDARAFLERVDDEQQRMRTYVASLEDDLALVEDRARRAELALDEARLEAWEDRVMRRQAEARAADAEAEVHKCETYLRKVYEILDRLNVNEHRPLPRG